MWSDNLSRLVPQGGHRTRLGICAACFLLLAVVQVSHGQQRARSLAGRVLAWSDSTPLPGVNVSIVGLGHQATTDAAGRFGMEPLPLRALRFVFQRVGLAADTVSVAADRVSIVIYLHTRAVQLEPIVTRAAPLARERFELLAQTSTMSLGPLEIQHIPGIAEPDVLRVVQLLPGNVVKNDFSTGLFVRGGESDQNLIRLDGIMVFNPTHLGGMFSTFDANAIEAVDIITGGFPAPYGGRLSSVLDVELLDGRTTDTELKGAISALSAKLLLDGPLFGTGASYVIGARRTYADQFADKFSDDPFTYYFGDAVAKLAVPLGGDVDLSVTGYWGRDDIEFPWFKATEDRERTDFKLDWGNRLVGVAVTHGLGFVEWEHRVSVSEFTARHAIVPDVFSFENQARALSAHTAVKATPGAAHTLRAGVGYDDYRLHYMSRDESLDRDLLDVRYEPAVFSAYADEQWNIAGRVLLRPGVRVEYVTGADEWTVAPRFSAKVFLTRDFALSGAVGRYYQPVQSLRNFELPIVLFDVWVGANALTPIAESDHVVVGLERWLDEQTSISVEGFTKSFNHLLVSNPFDDVRVVGDEFIAADGYSRGVDILLRRHMGDVKGWIAYTFAKAVRRIATDTFPPAHDRRHTLNLVIEAPGPIGSRMGIRWGYGSPLPYTRIVAEWLQRKYNPDLNSWDTAEREAISTRINGDRYPHYSRLDLSFHWEFEGLGGLLKPYLQIVNAYNKQNVFFYTFDYRSSPPTRSGFSQLPFLPTVGMEFEF